MERTDISEEQLGELARRIFPVIAKNGPAHTTMDMLARHLSMSKRTLYEIFGSKDDMIRIMMECLHNDYIQYMQEIISRSGNMMEVMANAIIYHLQFMSKLDAAFFRDMDDRYLHLRSDYESQTRKMAVYIQQAFEIGISQGVFRKDVNYKVIITLIRIQMESLKRMEEFFPPDVSITEAYNTISLSFLRSIATAKGMQTLEKITDKFNETSNGSDSTADKTISNINDNVTKE